VESDDQNNDEDDTSSTEDRLPNHFSWIDPVAAPKEKIAETFPSFSKRRECIVQLQAGQCLYLPASWFHCVSSGGKDDSSENRGGTECSCNGETTNTEVVIPPSVHMAINYWYHPPGNLADLEHPYQDRDYWEKAAADNA
jgi:Cupin-like domain